MKLPGYVTESEVLDAMRALGLGDRRDMLSVTVTRDWVEIKTLTSVDGELRTITRRLVVRVQ